MKKVILGIILGLVMFVVFIAFGGARYMVRFGKKTIDAGQKLQVYEKEIKESAGKAGEKIAETGKATKEKIEEAGGKTKDTALRAKKKVGDYVP
ncbi:MAG: hypothetical protein HY890_08190 [Deltaproteobacteria bacterium]|nr:hypothetical protein [Deltaproteobacteria bacterium]